MLVRSLLPSLLPRLCSFRPSLAMSSVTGTVTIQQPLNYRAGGRVQPVDGGQAEEVYEPATGTSPLPARGVWGVKAALRRGAGGRELPPCNLTARAGCHRLFPAAHVGYRLCRRPEGCGLLVAAFCLLQCRSIIKLFRRNQL